MLLPADSKDDGPVRESLAAIHSAGSRRRCSGLIRTQSEQVQGQRFGGDLLDTARCLGFCQDQAVGVFADLLEIARPQLDAGCGVQSEYPCRSPVIE
ncbi:MAG: hypothetical protein LC657_13980 [Desulfobacteraceae bacterium]|nr:hypothetical protein [Desulfobacteraceae bacterium]